MADIEPKLAHCRRTSWCCSLFHANPLFDKTPKEGISKCCRVNHQASHTTMAPRMTTIANANDSALGNNHFTSEHTFVDFSKTLLAPSTNSYEENNENNHNNSANQKKTCTLIFVLCEGLPFESMVVSPSGHSIRSGCPSSSVSIQAHASFGHTSFSSSRPSLSSSIS